MRLQDDGATALLHLDPRHPESDPLEWWRRGPFDHLYQGILEPYEVPGSALIIVCVQRHDRLVLYDPDTREVVGDVGLTTPSNATLHFRTHADELWVKEYDAVSRFRPGSWERLDTLRLQHTGEEFTREPIGSFWFPPDEEYCLIARPMSGEVVFLDTQTFKVVDSVHLGMEPLDAIALRDGAVFARDWQTRTLLRGHRS